MEITPVLQILTIVAALVVTGGPPPDAAAPPDPPALVPAWTARTVDQPDACTPCHTCAHPTRDDPCLRECLRAGRLASPSADPLSALPDLMILGDLASLYGPVPFDHAGHAQMAALDGGCTTCHHYSEDVRRPPACRSCHGARPAAEPLGMPGLKGVYHRQCLGCHRAWSGATTCNACHQPNSTATTSRPPAIPRETGLTLSPGHPVVRLQPSFVYETSHEPRPVVTFHHLDHAATFGLACADCHQGESCARCHGQSPRAHKIDFLQQCCTCHSQNDCGFCHQSASQPASFEHVARTGWPLDPNHVGVACSACHGDPGSFVTPARECGSCHGRAGGHGFDHRATGGSRDCAGCHADVIRAAAAAPVHHAAFTEHCATCHDPYAVTAAPHLREDVSTLCFSCHDEIQRNVEHAAVVHGATTGAPGCTSCHDPHGSSRPGLLRNERSTLCLGCHDRSIETDAGDTLASIADVLRSCPDQHGPVRDGDCGACHDPHAADRPRLLRASFPSGFYTEFKPEAYALCFSCHESAMVEAGPAALVTGFRDGDTNLHRLHVNREKGRTCLACHEVHASRAAFHIRDAATFDHGNWNLPIRFEQITDGGQCAPGCHRAQAYHRTPPAPDRSPLQVTTRQ